MLAQDAVPKEIANSKVRRLLARNHSYECTDAKVGDSALFYKIVGRRSAPRWRGPTVFLDIEGAGVAAKFQGQGFKVAMFCTRRIVDPEDAGAAEWKPAPNSSGGMEMWPPSALVKRGGSGAT